MTDLTGVVRMADGDLQVADRLGKLEEELRRRHRHEDETVVVLEHDYIEEAGDAVAEQQWHTDEGTDAAHGSEEFEKVTGADAEKPRRARTPHEAPLPT